MNNDSVELLRECNVGCKMAMTSMDQVKGYIREKDLKDTIDKYYDKHKTLVMETENLLDDYDAREKERPIAQGYSRVMTTLKMAMEHDSHQVAKIMMDGCNMGIQSTSEYLNQYESASPQSRNMAKEIIQLEENFMQELKEYL